MPKRGKKYIDITKNKENKLYNLEEAIEKAKEYSYSSFKGTIELHIALKPQKDKDPKSIKGTVSLPHSTKEKKVTVAVFTSPENEKNAKEAGADLVGTDEIIKDIKKGKIDFDVAIATPDVMPKIAQVGKELGPKGLMPNPKTGTVTDDIQTAIEEYKKGKSTFSADEKGVVHIGVGKTDLETEKITENIQKVLNAIKDATGKTEVSQIIKSIHLSPTMGPSVKISI